MVIGPVRRNNFNSGASRGKIYALVALTVLVCTALSVKWNVSAFQLRLATAGVPNEVETVVRGLDSADEAMLAVDVKPGSETYYTLDSVRKALVVAVQTANEQLQLALTTEHPNSDTTSITVRGVMIYLPPNIPKFEREVKAMYLSVAWMRTKQPEHVKTDFIIFTPEYNFAFPESIGCSSIPRSSRDQPEQCVVLPHVPLTKRTNDSEPLNDYGNYIDSMLILAEFQHTNQYDFLMRSDSDTFLAPGFAEWNLPPGVTIATGRGGYGSNNANAHLKWIATNPLGLSDSGLLGIGSTWYGQSAVMVAASRLTIEVMRWLDSQEFSEFEKKHSGVEGWPHWHWPVILLYGGHIAINQIPASKIIAHTEGVMELDYSSANTVTMPAAVKHIHCWHTDSFFSKFKFESGLYKGVDLNEYKTMESAAAYAGMIAISSDRMPASELRDLINNKAAILNQEWVRLTMG